MSLTINLVNADNEAEKEKLIMAIPGACLFHN